MLNELSYKRCTTAYKSQLCYDLHRVGENLHIHKMLYPLKHPADRCAHPGRQLSHPLIPPVG
jgi:hypothetical protein